MLVEHIVAAIDPSAYDYTMLVAQTVVMVVAVKIASTFVVAV